MSTPSTLQSPYVENNDIFRHMSFFAALPYNDLPNLPPALDLETKRVLKACLKARVALSALRQATALIPNPAVLINSIPLLEAQASSEIENIVTTTDALFRHAQLASLAADPATKDALRYRTALKAGFDSLRKRPVTTRTAQEVCTIIKDVHMTVAVRKLLEHTADFARKMAPKQYSRELIELVFVQPYCRIDNIVEAGIAKRQTASTYLHRLESVGILQQRQIGLNKLFVNSRFLKLLTSESNEYKRFGSKLYSNP